MSEDKINQIGLNDLLNFDSGKDWDINIKIPNRILRKYPTRVAWLQNQVKFLLEAFNEEIQHLERGFSSPVKIDRIEKPDEFMSDETKKDLVVKAKQEKEKERRGY
jgi:hypothetical protein